jgi:hypothetical protein
MSENAKKINILMLEIFIEMESESQFFEFERWLLSE